MCREPAGRVKVKQCFTFGTRLDRRPMVVILCIGFVPKITMQQQQPRRLTLLVPPRLWTGLREASGRAEQSVSEFVRATLRERLAAVEQPSPGPGAGGPTMKRSPRPTPRRFGLRRLPKSLRKFFAMCGSNLDHGRGEYHAESAEASHRT